MMSVYLTMMTRSSQQQATRHIGLQLIKWLNMLILYCSRRNLQYQIKNSNMQARRTILRGTNIKKKEESQTNQEAIDITGTLPTGRRNVNTVNHPNVKLSSKINKFSILLVKTNLVHKLLKLSSLSFNEHISHIYL